MAADLLCRLTPRFSGLLSRRPGKTPCACLTICFCLLGRAQEGGSLAADIVGGKGTRLPSGGLSCAAGAPCAGDLDGDGTVGLTDLAVLLSDFGTTGAAPDHGDLDGDVDLTDLGTLLAFFGTTCT